MTNDEKKKILRSYLGAQERIDDLCDEIQTLRAKATKVTTTISDMPQPTSGQHMGDVVAGYIEMVEQLEGEVRRCEAIKRDVECLISTIDDWTVERVMRLRYIDGMKWEVICVKMSYSWVWVHKLHSDGLNSIEIESVNGSELS